jgi:hypothetical protein
MSDDDRFRERRRPGQAGQSSMATLKQLPALVVLERLPVPVLAIDRDGTILFAKKRDIRCDARAHSRIAAVAEVSRNLAHPAAGRILRSRRYPHPRWTARRFCAPGRLDRAGRDEQLGNAASPMTRSRW